ncbi:uncharacterized protein zgc:66455 isoform X1 [Thunnus albacares]|uniref:uncharacterized protein zgc:66455 isoform X1 n=1 Tax=Thunnus albacares TaxID=8236 RepID=UPI001CF666C0|nr:uncharacterized protein zgc:66455 isoform X1 [Thunnus albacares]
MPQTNSFTLKSVLLIFLLIFGIFWKHCNAQVNGEEVNKSPDEHGADGGAFFALRSCHQRLNGDNGEFFSPDYLCSNPPLWCNWTVQVDPGKRIHLHLEDLTPDEACHLKQDQIHVDEPVSHVGSHKVLQKCWQEAKYTSSSNTLYVVLLIGGWPSLPYRGFYGRYQAFGPPVVYNPQEGFTEKDKASETSHELLDFSEFGPVTAGEQMESGLLEHLSPVNSDLMYDYYDQPATMTAGLLGDTDTEVGENYHLASKNYSHVYPFTAMPTVPGSTQGTSRSGRGAAQTPSDQSDPAVHPASPQEQHDSPSLHPNPSPHTPTAIGRNAEVASTLPQEEAAVPGNTSLQSRSEEEKSAEGSGRAAEGENRTEVSQASDQHPSASEAPEPEETEQIHPHPNMVEPLSDHRGNLNIRNHSEIPLLPGDHLFEAAVEVNFSADLEESWDDLAKSLLMSVKALISKQLEALHTPLSISPKRIKRLSAGVLYILWLQISQGPGGPRVHRAVHSTIQSLIATGFGLRGNHEKAVVISVSTADVNECGTQVVLCDVNADCVNRFGSYSCHCKPGFQDESRLGSGGTVCVDVKTTGCSSGLSAETKGVYVLFFLLSSLILMLLVAAGMLYRRHHRGAFSVRCHSCSSIISPPDPNDNNNNNHHHYRDDSYSSPADSDLPPPPPPARGPREGWPQVKERCPAVDLPLLRFSPLLPPDGYMEPQEGGKM